MLIVSTEHNVPLNFVYNISLWNLIKITFFYCTKQLSLYYNAKELRRVAIYNIILSHISELASVPNFLVYTTSDPFYVALNKPSSRLYVDILIKEQQRIQRIAASICIEVSLRVFIYIIFILCIYYI